MDRLLFDYMGYKGKKSEEIISELEWPIDIKDNYKELIDTAKVVFYNGNALVTSINSCELGLREDFLDGLCKTIAYLENKKNKEFGFILDFLTTYLVGSKNYSNKDEKNKVEAIFNNNNLTSRIYNDYKNDLLDFYNSIIDYAKENDIYISDYDVKRMYNNFAKNTKLNQSIIDKLVENNQNIPACIILDKKIKKNAKYYINYLYYSLENIFGFNYFSEVLTKLSEKNVLNDDENKDIINAVIKKVNDVCIKAIDKELDFINMISMIEEMVKMLNGLLNKCNSFTEVQKIKIRECITSLLYIKRKIVSDNEYANLNSHEHVFESKIPSEEVDEIKNVLTADATKLYKYMQIDFVSSIEKSIEQYAISPLYSLVTRMYSNEKDAIYEINIEEKVDSQNRFKEIFDEIGKKYTEAHNNLTNKLNKNYYEQLLIYLSTYYNLHQSLVISMLKCSNTFYQIIENLSNLLGYSFKNQYAIAVANTISIEQNIVKILQKNNIENQHDGLKNLCSLIDFYKNNKNYLFILNGLMFINYTLYEDSGRDLRNRLFHGNMLGKDLDEVLIETFSGLIFVSWLLDE